MMKLENKAPQAAGIYGGAGRSVTLSGICKSYGLVDAVRDVDLDIGASEFVAVLGPSGSGKTTLLMMIAGFEVPSGGSIHVDGVDITRVPPNRRNIGVVFQRYALFPHMTLAANIAFPLRMRGWRTSEIDARVEAALSLVRLNGYGGRYPSEISGGQQQRVALARATVFDPPVLLMDEPLGALDRRLRQELQFEIKDLQRRIGATVIYVTHDQEEAITMSDRIVVMDGGAVQQIGSAEELYARPTNRFVAGFIGESNFIPAKCIALQGDGSGCWLEAFGCTSFVALCAKGAPPRAGEAAVLAIRPEKLKISVEAQAEGVAATITDIVFTGAAYRVFLSMPDGASVSAVLQRVEDMPIGSEVRISWPLEAGTAFADAQS